MFLKKFLVLLFFIFILSGCATYKFQKSASSANQGYLVSYNDKPIVEYTVGKEKSLPDLILARERFKRRRPTVEYYYKKTGQIESRFKEDVWGFPAMFVDFIGGILRWPYTAISDYRYNHNPKYRERVDKLEEEKDAFEKARINSLKEKLAAYIDKDLANEHLSETKAAAAPVTVELPSAPQVLPVTPELKPQAMPIPPVVQEAVVETEGPAPAATIAPQPVVEKVLPAEAPSAPPLEAAPPVKPAAVPPVAVIIAKPVKGYSALKVNFSGQKSHSKSGKIISYFWDFGDGDTSAKKNPENTYWSTTYGSRKFIATLTVKDEAGGTSSASTEIEVLTR